MEGIVDMRDTYLVTIEVSVCFNRLITIVFVTYTINVDIDVQACVLVHLMNVERIRT